MKIIHTKVGPVHTNNYIVYDENTKKAVIIDPGEKALVLLDLIKENGLELEYILLTHGHFDHVVAVAEIKRQTGAKLVAHKKELVLLDKSFVDKTWGRYIKGEYEEAKVDIFAVDGTEIEFGTLKAEFLHTPGHSKGSCVIKIADSLFTGDTLFAGECGRCDLLGGNFEQMLSSLKKIAELSGDYKIYPGHEQFSTLNEERSTNRYMLQAMGH